METQKPENGVILIDKKISVSITAVEELTAKTAMVRKMMGLIKFVTPEKIEYSETLIESAKNVKKVCEEVFAETMRPFIEAKESINEEQNKVKLRYAEITKPMFDAMTVLQNQIREAKRLKKGKTQIAITSKTVDGIKNQAASPVIHVDGTFMAYEVVDETRVPRGYCSPSNELIQQAIRGGIRNIAGLKIYSAVSGE